MSLIFSKNSRFQIKLIDECVEFYDPYWPYINKIKIADLDISNTSVNDIPSLFIMGFLPLMLSVKRNIISDGAGCRGSDDLFWKIFSHFPHRLPLVNRNIVTVFVDVFSDHFYDCDLILSRLHWYRNKLDLAREIIKSWGYELDVCAIANFSDANYELVCQELNIRKLWMPKYVANKYKSNYLEIKNIEFPPVLLSHQEFKICRDFCGLSKYRKKSIRIVSAVSSNSVSFVEFIPKIESGLHSEIIFKNCLKESFDNVDLFHFLKNTQSNNRFNYEFIEYISDVKCIVIPALNDLTESIFWYAVAAGCYVKVISISPEFTEKFRGFEGFYLNEWCGEDKGIVLSNFLECDEPIINSMSSGQIDNLARIDLIYFKSKNHFEWIL